MEPTYLGIFIAPLVAVIVSIIDLSVHRDKGLYRKALPLCVLYAIFDAAAALILLAPLRAGAELLINSPTTAAAVTAGLVAPLLMRTKVPVPFTRDKQTVNAVAMLRRLQIRVSAEIDDLCAVGETEWILDVVLPNIRVLSLAEVEAWAIQSINVKYKGPDARALRRKCIEDLKKAVADPISEDDRKHLMIQMLIDRCGRHQVTALVKRAKKKAKIAGTSTPHLKTSQTLELESGTAGVEGDPVDPEGDTSPDDDTDDTEGGSAV